MVNYALTLLAIAYACVGVVATVGYWPTIKDLLAHKPSANVASYVIWTACASTTFLYSLFILQDTLFRFVSGLNFLSCAAILILSLRSGIRHRTKKKR